MKKKQNKFYQWLLQNKKPLIVFLVYLVITFISIWFHEDWEDEIQAWLTARDCNLIELIGRMKIEGHFLPWYLIIMPFAKLGFPYKTMNIISWLLTSIAAWLMLKKLPCKFYKRALIIFTLPMLYFYPVLARCYCLLPLGTILAIIFFKNRLQNPLPYLLSIILIANTHIYCFSFAFILGIDFLQDFLKNRKKLEEKQIHHIIKSVIITIILAITSFLPLLNCQINEDASMSSTKFNPTFSLTKYLVTAPNDFLNHAFPLIPRWIILIPIFSLLTWSLFNNKKILLKLIFIISWWFFIYNSIFTLVLPARATMLMFVTIFFLSTDNISKTQPYSKIVNILTDILYLALLIVTLIKTGNLLISILITFFFIFKFIPYALKKYDISIAQSDFNKKIININLLILSCLSIVIGIIYTISDYIHPFTEASATADYINNHIKNDSLLLTTEASIIYSSLSPRLKNKINLYDISTNKIYTYTENLTTKEQNIDESMLTKYCSDTKTNLYFLIAFNLQQEKLFELNGTDSDHFLNKLVNKNTLVQIYNSHKSQQYPWPEQLPYPVNEHYKLFQINCNNL